MVASFSQHMYILNAKLPHAMGIYPSPHSEKECKPICYKNWGYIKKLSNCIISREIIEFSNLSCYFQFLVPKKMSKDNGKINS